MPKAYAHMKVDEAAIWERFLVQLPWRTVAIEYDLRLGDGVSMPLDAPEWVRKMAWSLSTKRVDVMIETRNEFVIVEVKGRAGLSAVGQLLGYLSLFTRQYKPQKRVKLVLVCEEIAPDVAPVLREYGIETYLV